MRQAVPPSVLLLALIVVSLAGAQAVLTPYQVIQRAAARAVLDNAALDNYAYHQRDIVSSLHQNGTPPSLRSDETDAVSQVDGIDYEQVIARKGEPLSPKDAAKEARKAAAFIRKHRGPKARAKALAAQVKAQKQQQQLLQAIPDAFAVAFDPAQTSAACVCYAVTLKPKPGYKPPNKDLKMLQHVAATVWISKGNFAMMQVHIRILQPISVGWVLARIEPNSTITLTNEAVDGHWFEKSIEGRINARFLLLKHFHLLLNETCSDYRKFTVSARVLTGKISQY